MIEQRGEPIAAIIGIEDLKRLEMQLDQAILEYAKETPASGLQGSRGRI